jgi:uncharacterized protein (TIGR00730 family)
MTRLCVFCGSSPGAKPEYAQAARALGEALAARRIGLVYGGARVGTMDVLASTVLDLHGDVIGVMPRELVEREIARTDLPDLRIVGTMHERKALMADLADAFIALPGGLGTLDELFEVLALATLDGQRKPCGLLNICGYYDDLIRFLHHAELERFVAAAHLSMLSVSDQPDSLIDAILSLLPRSKK